MRPTPLVVASVATWFLSTTATAKRTNGFPDFEFPFQHQPKTRPHQCPAKCDEAGPVPFSWPIFPNTKTFGKCNETVIFSLALSKDSDSGIRACTMSGSSAKPSANKYGPPCLPSVKPQDVVADVDVSWQNEGARVDSASGILTALQHLRKTLLEDPTCDATTILAKSGDTVLGLYVGGEVRKSSVASLLDRFAEFAGKSGRPRRKARAQICGPAGQRAAAQTFGIIFDTTGSLDTARDALAHWTRAECLARFDGSEAWKDVKFGVIPAVALTMGPDAVTVHANSTGIFSNSTASSNSSAASVHRRSHGRVIRPRLLPDQSPNPSASPFETLAPRADCRVARVQAGDSCWSLATQRCNPTISLEDFYQFNGSSDRICSTIAPGDYVCCSSGTLPNLDPPSNSDGTCKYVQVQSGDTCDSIAQNRCPERISVSQLTKFNGGSQSFCSNLKPKAIVCCSQGQKPDLRPKPNPDGTCATHAIKPDDTCDGLEGQYTLNPGDIERFNQKKTWGFTNCSELKDSMLVCVSEGKAPMPAPVHNAICGPQVPGTKPPTDGTKLADLNPCPLNVCCNIWGQCGITQDFCTDTSVDGAPGTARPGTWGCISNCGIDIVNNEQKPASFERIAYFEAWNQGRPCLNMDITEVTAPHTIIHFAFGWINEDFTVTVKDVDDQWDQFVKMKTNLKKVISYGGWAFSNDAPTSHIIRQAVRPENRIKFAQNVAQFVVDNNLDGVDFDWEYPGARDIEGSDPGTPEDGQNYLEFMKVIRRRLPYGKTLSFAAPASYWYLRNFPMAEIAQVVDYIVYMTYDLHGQWDAGNKYATEGCEGGNCLRSHVNITETINALAMITKAGVPAHKVYVGISSYGRSFKMAEAGCDGPDCLYLGDRYNSLAKAGECTLTPGYIANAEIDYIIQTKRYFDTVYEFHDEASDSDIVVYDWTEWVAYMNDDTKEKRVQWYKSMNFGGVSDWAVDLQAESEHRSGGLLVEPMDLDYKCDLQDYNNLDEVLRDIDKSEGNCLAMNVIRALQHMLERAMDGYDEAADGYDDVFGFYRDYMHETMGEHVKYLMLREDQPLATYFDCYYDNGSSGKRENAKRYDCKNPPRAYMGSFTFFWELRDRNGFNKALSEYGIDPEWLEFGTWDDERPCAPTQGHSNCLDVVESHRGFPLAKKNFEVPNPKEVVDEARKNFDKMMDQYTDMYFMLGLDQFMGSPADVIEVLAMPVVMLEDAVESMKEVKRIGKEERERKKKEFILKIIEGILFLIPFVGMAIGNLGRAGASIARMMMAIEAAGSSALAVYEIVENPEMAPVAIMAMLLGGLSEGGIRGAVRYRELALSKGKLTQKQKDSLGKAFKRENPKIEALAARVCSNRR